MSSQCVLFTLTLLLITQLLYQAPLLQFYPPSVPWRRQDSRLKRMLQLTAGGAPRQPGGRNPRVRWHLPASESLTRKGPAPQHLPACSVYEFRACLLCTLTSAGKGSPAFLYQRKHSCLMQRASKLTERNLRCCFLVFRISAKPTPLWPSKQQLGSFQGRDLYPSGAFLFLYTFSECVSEKHVQPTPQASGRKLFPHTSNCNLLGFFYSCFHNTASWLSVLF